MRWKRGSRLQLVSEDEASPRTREIFVEVRERLGVAAVPALYRAYAAFPEFLELHWQAFRPVIESRPFFVMGARLAAECYTRAHNYFELPAIPCQAQVAETLPLAQVLDYYQYLDPLLLLVTAAQMQAFEGPIGQRQEDPEAAQHPVFPVTPCSMSDSEAPSAVHRIWEERRRVLELAFVSDEHRALACWPDFYQPYWAELKELLRSPLYADCQYRIGESALKLARELPVTLETTIPQLWEAGLDDRQISSLARINAAFMQALTGLVLDITFARIGYEGGTMRERNLNSEDRPPQKPVESAGAPSRAA
jgi:hypothetical protein